MTALTQDRDTTKKYGQRVVRVPASAGAEAFEGGLLAIGTDGFGVAASDLAGLRVVGRCAQGGDNTAGADGDIEFIAEPGVFSYTMSAALLALGQAHVGKAVYVVDDQTVGLADDVDQLVLAGTLEELDDDGVGCFVAVGLGVNADAAALAFSALAPVNDAQVSPELTVPGIEGVIRIALPDAATATYVFAMAEKVEIIDAWAVKEGAGAANTVQLTDAADAAISDAMAFAVDNALTRAAVLDPAKTPVAAGATFKVVNTRAAGSSAGTLFVKVIKRD